jgi:predicted tellurium resistance membrane protein TerC
MNWLADPNAWIALLTLTVLEVVLGIDNVVFIAILASRLPRRERPRARLIGLGGAMVTRIVLLLAINWMMGLTRPLLTVLQQSLSGRDLILMTGGLFLIGKATFEIHDKLEGTDGAEAARRRATLLAVVIQITLLDVVFSIDSVITAVGMAEQLAVMVAAIVISVLIMMASSGPVARFIESHPTVKMLALSFLLLIGTTLLAEGAGLHIPKGYIYFAMGFSMFVEALNLRIRALREPIRLHGPGGA